MRNSRRRRRTTRIGDKIEIFATRLFLTTPKLPSSSLSHSQILCLVHENNDLFFRYTNYDAPDSEQVTVKLLPWFNEHGKVVQDISFDPSSNERLLVLCDENTLHIVPVLAIVQEQQQQQQHNNTSSSTESSTNSSRREPTTRNANLTLITSYVIPFVGPHECPNPRTCPNNFYRPVAELENSLKTTLSSATDCNKSIATLDDLYSTQSVDRLLSSREATSTYLSGDDQEGSTSTEADHQEEVQKDGIVCPYPTACIWWQTRRKQDRAIIGYSDGSVCFLCKDNITVITV